MNYLKFLQHFGNSVSRASQVTTVPCQTVKNGCPGRPSVDILPEVLEDLRGLGFTWEKIARIFRVSRWTIMRGVRLFDIEHLSLFRTMTDEEIDSIIRDFIARHGSTTGETYLRGHFRALGYSVQKRRIREPEPGRSEERSFQVGCRSITKGVLCPVAKFVVAHRWTSLINSLGICNSRMHRWLFTNNNFHAHVAVCLFKKNKLCFI